MCVVQTCRYAFSLSLSCARARSLSHATHAHPGSCAHVSTAWIRETHRGAPPPSHGQSKRRLRGQIIACLAYPGSSGGSFPPLLDTARSPKNQTRNSHHNGNQNRKWSKSTGLRPFIRPHITTKYQIWRENTLVAGLWLLGHGRIMQIM